MRYNRHMVKFGNNVVRAVSPRGPVRLWDAGVTWGHIQPQEGVWNWSKLDAYVDQIGGRQCLLVLGHPAEWAAKGGSDGQQAPWLPAGANRPPVNDDAWAHYVVSVAQRYRGRIDQYQIWNEPTFKTFYSGTFPELAALTKRSRSLIRRTDPDAKIVAAPFIPRSAPKRQARLRTAFKEEGDPFDIWSAHIYPRQNYYSIAWRNMAREAKKIIGHTDKPLWITETNYNLMGSGNPYPPEKQRRLLDKTEKMCNNNGVSRVYWYAYDYPNPSILGITNLDFN